MSRIDRYLFREIAVPLLVSVLVVALLVFLLQARRLATAALGLGLTLEDVLVIFSAALPPFLVLAIPIAFLLSVLIGFGRLSQDLELTALSAAGASPLRIARVPLVLGAAVSLLALPVALVGEPYGLRVLRDRLVDVGLKNLTQAVQPGVFNEDFRGNAVYAGGADHLGRLQDVFVFDERDAERPVMVTSERGGFVTDGGRVVFTLESGELHLGTGGDRAHYDRLRFERLEMGLDAEEEISRRTKFVSPIGQMSGDELLEKAREEGPDSPFGRRIEKAYWRRYAFPAMAFGFGLIATAIALSGPVRARARNAILGMLAVVGYYVLTRIADLAVVRYPGTPLLGAFLPNLVVLAVGLWVLSRSGRPR